MIRIDELMVGDWVMDNRSNTPLKVNPFLTIKNEIPEWNPIPLTPEILEKNGFGKLVTYWVEKWIYGDIRMNIYSSNGCWRFCADTKRNEDSVVYIHFVHELQHALRLCGIEKEIEL